PICIGSGLCQAASFMLASLALLPAQAQTRHEAGEWPAYSGDLGSTRYSPLDQIDASNVADLRIAWRWSAANFGPTPEFNYRVTPLMIDGVLYATAGSRRTVAAIDAVTGETLWTHRLDEGERGAVAPRVNSGRGVAYWERSDDDGRIFYITPGYQLISLDIETGIPDSRFGDDGAVDLMESLRIPEGVSPIGTIGSSSPPIVVNDVVIMGSAHVSGRAQPVPQNIPGDIRGFDARTGELLWSFHVVPEDGEFGADTWENGSNRFSGNSGVWTMLSADAERGIVYLPTEAPTHDWYGGHRLGDNLFSSSVVALDVRTGERIWHYQLVHHDIWDFDNPAAPILADIEVDGEPIPAVVQITKQGWAYVFNRETGEPVWPIEERRVPASNVPGERASRTQPFPTKPPPFARQGFSLDELIDFTPELNAQAREIVNGYSYGPLFKPPTIRRPDLGIGGFITLPRSVGGGNWEGGALDPDSGILYITSLDSPTIEALIPGSNPDGVAFDMMAPNYPLLVDGLPVIRPPYGVITAMDLNAGEILWQIPNADTPEEIANHPALADIDIGRTGRAARVGLLATATLLFAGEGVGGKPILRAHDKLTGEIIAEIDLPAAQTGLPMSYAIDAQQYIVVAVAQADHPAELVALKLP
ncbi:MAG: PQQ-binding-like beta-propeller repeat protein, partial [Gammaproteobacteria bacterium]